MPAPNLGNHYHDFFDVCVCMHVQIQIRNVYTLHFFQRSPRLPSLIISVASQEFPKTSLCFYNFLEELTDFIKAVMLTIMFYYKEKEEIKISQRKSPIEQGPEGSKSKTLVVPPIGVVWTALTSSRNDVRQFVLTTIAYPSLGVQSFI